MTAPEIPRGFPVRPLGRDGNRYAFLTAQGQLRTISATELEKRANLVDLFVGCEGDPEQWLVRIGPSKRKRDDATWNPSAACDWLMRACAARPLFDAETPVRSYGTWRGEGGAAVAHAGDALHHAHGVTDPAGDIFGGAIYPAAPARGAPAGDIADPAEVRHVLTEIAGLFAWARPTDADAWLGWVGMATLGAFPEWRPHLWVAGRRGSGKSELVEIAHRLLGPMSPGVMTDASEAGLRQGANNQARPMLLDETERGDRDEHLDAVLRLFRHMAGGEGSRVVRGSANHQAVTFRLIGAGYCSSILTADLEPQDRSRFVMLELRALARPDHARLLRLQDLARDLGPRLWRRMLAGSVRWDREFRVWRDLCAAMGADARDASTVGAVLTGWHILLSDDPPDEEALKAGRGIAAPLVADAQAAAEEGEGEKCLRRIMAGLIEKEHGGRAAVYELIVACYDDASLADNPSNRTLRRAGMRVARPDPAAPHVLWIVQGAHPWLDRALAGTRWAGGGHNQALKMLDGVAPLEGSRQIQSKVRVLQIPHQYMPGKPE